MKNVITPIKPLLLGLLASLATLSTPVFAEDGPQQILFTNASVFDGFAPGLIEGANVLVEGNVITQVSTGSIDAPDAKVINATGKYLTPGLIDMHTHSMFYTPEGSNSYQDEWDAPGGGAMAAQGLHEYSLIVKLS